MIDEWMVIVGMLIMWLSGFTIATMGKNAAKVEASRLRLQLTRVCQLHDKYHDDIIQFEKRFLRYLRGELSYEELHDNGAQNTPMQVTLLKWAKRPENQPPASWWKDTTNPFKPEEANSDG